jgi:hypothetical protein
MAEGRGRANLKRRLPDSPKCSGATLLLQCGLIARTHRGGTGGAQMRDVVTG